MSSNVPFRSNTSTGSIVLFPPLIRSVRRRGNSPVTLAGSAGRDKLGTHRGACRSIRDMRPVDSTGPVMFDVAFEERHASINLREES